MSKSKQISQLQERIAMLEKALLPFAKAASGFEHGDIYLEYRETDKQYYELYTDDEALSPLTTNHLLEAAKILPIK